MFLLEIIQLELSEMDWNVITYFHDIFLCSLSPEDLHDGVIQLRYVLFQDVTSITASELVVISLILFRVQ